MDKDTDKNMHGGKENNWVGVRTRTHLSHGMRIAINGMRTRERDKGEDTSQDEDDYEDNAKDKDDNKDHDKDNDKNNSNWGVRGRTR